MSPWRIERHATELEDRRHDVNETDRFGDGAGLHRPRPVHDERHADLFFVCRESVPPLAMLAERLSVIRGDDEQRPRGQPEVREMLIQAADLAIVHRHLGIVGVEGIGAGWRRRARFVGFERLDVEKKRLVRMRVEPRQYLAVERLGWDLFPAAGRLPERVRRHRQIESSIEVRERPGERVGWKLRRRVSPRAEIALQGWRFVRKRIGVVVRAYTMGLREQPRQQRGDRRLGPRSRRVGMLKHQAAAPQVIEKRRPVSLRAVQPKAIGA